MCVFDDGLELCPECNLCELCCMENTQAEGCDCGEYCVSQSEWFEHICSDCGTPFCNVEQCELCGICLDCCEGNSDCSDGMCVMDPEYDEHFCDDCGDCTHNITLCEICYDAGELRCEDCCDILAEDEGCDCGDMCINDPGFYTHIAQEHLGEGGSHTASAQSVWMFNENFHWHECKYCDDPNHSKLGVNYHSYNNYGVCKICGYDKNSKILILKQPISRVCSVSDNQAEAIDDPLHPYNNSVKFTVAAKGLSELSYQWFYSYGSSWKKCEDVSVKEGPTTFIVSKGSKTNTLVTDVPTDICYNTCYYKCIITDEEGNEVETAPAAVRSRHIYKKCYPQRLERITAIYSNKTDFVEAYESTGHYTYCLGDGCDEKKLIPHNFEKQKTVVTCYYTKISWVRTVCKDCGYEKFTKQHDHYFVDKENDKYKIDYNYKNSINHKLACLFDGCDKTTLEPHTFMSWQNVGSPYNTQNGIGSPYKECQLCSYQLTRKPQRYDKNQNKNVNCDWTKQNDLIYVKYGGANSDIAYVGDKIIVSFSPSTSDKTDYIKKQYPKCIAWNVYYYCDTGKTVVDKNVSQYFSFTRISGTANWEVYIPEFADRLGGGMFTFEPVIDPDECTHTSGTRLSGAYDPICIQDGYTGDVVCVDCGKVVEYGEIIEGGSEHEGELILNPLTVREGSCEHRGYSGTSRCSVCHMSVRGKSTPKVHTGEQTVIGYQDSTCYEFGQTGDVYCECGTHLKSSRLIAPEHKNTKLVGYVAPTSNSDGYTGDTVCQDCDLVLKYGYTLSSDKIVSSIEIGDAIEPTTGKNPDYTATVLTAGVIIDRFSTPEINRGVDWKDSDTLSYVYPHNIFKRSKNYMITVRVKTNDGNIFSGDVTATVNGKAANVYVDPSSPDYATVTYEFPYTSYNYVKEIHVTNVAKPLPGTNPVYDCTLDNDYLYVVDEIYWSEDGEGMNYEDTFKEGKKYKFFVGIAQNYDNWLETCMFEEDVKVYINGKLAQIETVRDDYVFAGVEMDLNASVKGTVSASGDASDYVTMYLIPEGTTEPAYEFISKGNNFNYEFGNVEKGEYTLKVTKKKHKVFTADIVVSGEDIVKNITLLPDPDAPQVKPLINSSEVFPDVKSNDWFKQYVDFAVTYGIFNGQSDGKFAPNKNITRGQFVQVLANISKADTSSYKSHKNFNDVNSNDWFAGAVNWAYENGIASGDGKGGFNPNGNITREQMCVLLVRFAQFKGFALNVKEAKINFADDAKISSWAKDYVYKCQMADLVNGTGTNTFNPQGNTLRCQAATVFTLFYKDYIL